MDDTSSNNSNSYSALNTNSNPQAGVNDASEAPSRFMSNSWGFRSNSLPRTSSSGETSSKSGPSAWAKSFQSWTSIPKDSQNAGSGGKTGFNLFNNIGFHKQTTVKIPVVEAPLESTSAPASPSQENGPFNSFKTGFLNGSRNAVKAVQTKARHMVSQNKRRYQEGGFDLDLSYITENIIAMGFPAGDMSSGFFGYVEGLYRNHMEEVIKFLETQHKGKYKVYNLCSERLYDAALFEGKVACFPFDDHNCPQLQLISSFCHSAYSWLKGDLENVVVVHCKAGMARTGLMISCLLLYLKFFPTCEESISYYNQKRCIDGKGLVLPSQLRYVKYFERVLREFDGETPKGRKCILRGIRLHRCPYWIRPAITVADHSGTLFSSKKHPRTKDMMSEDIWFAAPRKGVMVFALPGERCIADINGDFKRKRVMGSHSNGRDHSGGRACAEHSWLNTNMMESRQILLTSDLDGFDKRRLPSPGFQVEVVVLDHDAPWPTKSKSTQIPSQLTDMQAPSQTTQEGPVPKHPTPGTDQIEMGNKVDKDNIFTDSEGEDGQDTPKKARGVKKGIDQGDGGKEHVVVGEDGNAAGGSISNSAGTFSMRNAMDRMGISPVGWTSKPDSPPNDSTIAGAASDSVSHEGVTSTLPLSGSPGNAQEKLEILSPVSRVGEVDGPLEGRDQAGELGPEDAAGKGTELLDTKHVEKDGNESFKGDELPQRRETAELVSAVAQSDFQAIAVASAADASVFTFGDEEDYESEE